MTVFKTDARSNGRVIDGMIENVRKHYTKAGTSVQIAGLAIIEHAIAYGDCDRAKHLCRAVPARERNSLIGWFQMFSPIGVQMGKPAKDDKCRLIKPESAKYNAFNLDGARANMWYDDPAGVNPVPKPLNTLGDFYHIVDSMLKKAIKDAEEGDKYDPEQADTVKAEAETLRKMIGQHRAKSLAATEVNATPDNAAQAHLETMLANARGIEAARG